MLCYLAELVCPAFITASHLGLLLRVVPNFMPSSLRRQITLVEVNMRCTVRLTPLSVVLIRLKVVTVNWFVQLRHIGAATDLWQVHARIVQLIFNLSLFFFHILYFYVIYRILVLIAEARKDSL